MVKSPSSGLVHFNQLPVRYIRRCWCLLLLKLHNNMITARFSKFGNVPLALFKVKFSVKNEGDEKEGK